MYIPDPEATGFSPLFTCYMSCAQVKTIDIDSAIGVGSTSSSDPLAALTDASGESVKHIVAHTNGKTGSTS